MQLAAALTAALGREVMASSERRVSGGSINSSSRFDTADGPIFVKHGDASCLPMFQAEADGLTELALANAVRIPNVLAMSREGATAFLVLEWLELARQKSRLLPGVSKGPRPLSTRELDTATASSEAKLGERLALQHRVTRDRFGWHRDNTIGSTPQSNRLTEQWVDFFRLQRLLPQLTLAASNGASANAIDRGHRLCERLDDFFRDHQPAASLLHGDLWGGNWGADGKGEPVLFDPAVYFGDRETDLAMTRLFGGFHAPFYAAYQAAWPLDAGAEVRVTLYNLYHVLNHFNLFGGGYLRQAQGMIQRLLAEVGH